VFSDFFDVSVYVFSDLSSYDFSIKEKALENATLTANPCSAVIPAYNTRSRRGAPHIAQQKQIKWQWRAVLLREGWRST
jgi:hypothetical protein